MSATTEVAFFLLSLFTNLTPCPVDFIVGANPLTGVVLNEVSPGTTFYTVYYQADSCFF